MDLDWCMERLRERGSPADYPDDCPAWVASIDPESESLDLHAAAWTKSEARELALWERVDEHNQRLWGEHGYTLDLSPSERLQVCVTNDYRRLLGRRPLAWNPALFEAAAMHAAYMDETGLFGHLEVGRPYPLPEDRMRSKGYDYPVGENCHIGSVGPAGAHQAWLRSSAHHRNLVSQGVTEMAAAVEGSYWTQVFGRDTAWQKPQVR